MVVIRNLKHLVPKYELLEHFALEKNNLYTRKKVILVWANDQFCRLLSYDVTSRNHELQERTNPALSSDTKPENPSKSDNKMEYTEICFIVFPNL